MTKSSKKFSFLTKLTNQADHKIDWKKSDKSAEFGDSFVVKKGEKDTKLLIVEQNKWN